MATWRLHRLALSHRSCWSYGVHELSVRAAVVGFSTESVDCGRTNDRVADGDRLRQRGAPNAQNSPQNSPAPQTIPGLDNFSLPPSRTPPPDLPPIRPNPTRADTDAHVPLLRRNPCKFRASCQRAPHPRRGALPRRGLRRRR